jgi:asparagine synthase (glutamine-hydrolysing)
LEVRCPLLDHHLIEYVASLPSVLKLRGTQTKRIFRDLVRPMLPASILNRGKMGFAVPVGKWLRTDLRPLIHEYVLGSGTRHDLFDGRFVQKLWREHLSGVRERTPELWGILMFNLWYDRFVRQTSSSRGTTDRAHGSMVTP